MTCTDVISVHVVYMNHERSEISVLHANRKTRNFGWLEILINPLGTSIKLYLHIKFQLVPRSKHIPYQAYIFSGHTQQNSKTHNIKCYNLVVLGYTFRPHCGHLQANLYKLSALNVRTIWDTIVCTFMTYVR